MKAKLILVLAAGALIQGNCKKDDKPPVVDAEFSITGYEMPVPSTINFVNTSTNATSYLWDFGDGTTSTQANPSHQFTAIGTYTLRLKAMGAAGTDSICKLVTLDKISTGSTFSYFFDRCSGAPVGAAFRTLNPASTGVYWNFSGVVNISRDPVIQFLFPGDYTVKYSTSINGVRDTVTRIIQIQ